MGKAPRQFQNLGPLAPRIEFWRFATDICGIGEPGSKVVLTTAQRAIWKSVDKRVDMTPEEAETYRKLTGKPPWPAGSRAAPFLCLALSRGAGKSLLLSLIAVFEAVTNPYQAQGGETVGVVCLAPKMKQSRMLLSYARSFFDRPTLAPFLESAVSEELRLTNGRLIRTQAVDKDGGSARGITVIAGLFDESAYLSWDGKIVDEDLWRAVLAGARGVEQFRGVLSSSARGKSGFFYTTFYECFGKQDAPWEVMKGPQPLIRPDMDRGLLQEYMRADEEAFKREFLVDFSASSGSQMFYVAGQVEACIMASITTVEPTGPTASYACAVDPSGGTNDVFTVCVIEKLEDGTIRQCLARGWDPKESPISVHDIAKEIRDLVAPYGIRTVYGDIFGGQWVAEAFMAVGLDYKVRGFNAQLKLQRAACLREQFQTGRIKLLDIPVQTTELCRYEQRTLPSGTISVGHPNTKDGSDDYLDALGLAVWELVGHVYELHPPDALESDDRNRRNRELYAGGQRPSEDKFMGRGLAVPLREIAELGSGPAWLAENALKHWKYALYSMGELANLAGVPPAIWLCHWGSDVVLQHVWMRWILATMMPKVVVSFGELPGIPAWVEIKRRIVEAGTLSGIVNFWAAHDMSETQVGDAYILPGGRSTFDFNSREWPVDLFRSEPTRARQPACPPWEAPKEEWGFFPKGDQLFNWRDQIWKLRMTGIFSQASRETYERAVRLKYQRSEPCSKLPDKTQDESIREQTERLMLSRFWRSI